jgi:hypothetical protein
MVLECLDFPAVVARQQDAERERLRRKDDDGADDEGTNEEIDLKNEPDVPEVWQGAPRKNHRASCPQNLHPGQSMADARF